MASDQLDLASAQIVNAPDVRSWPATAAITALSFGTNGQTRVEFTKKNGPDRWPDVTSPGWDGPLQYTLWLFLKIGGQWVGSGFIQFWNSRDGSGKADDPDVPSVYDQHWYYAPRWAPMHGHGPIAPGETIGFMVTSGNARDSVGPYGPQERSNVVVLAATDHGAFTFAETPTPEPIPVPPVPPIPGLPGPPGPKGDKGDKGDPGSGVDLKQIFARLDALEQRKVPTGVRSTLSWNGVSSRLTYEDKK